MRMKSLAAVGLLAGSALVLTACGDLDFDFGPRNEAVEKYDIKDAVTTLRIEAGSGDVVVNESARTGIAVTETLHYRGDKPTDGHEVGGGTLTLSYTCANCAIDYNVEVPKGLNVKVETGSGEITLRALSGPVDVSTGSGEVDASGLLAKTFVAEAGSGSIEAKFSAAPDSVTIETGSGDGIAWVPGGTYNATLHTGSGERAVEVTNDPAAPKKIVIQTGSGDSKVLKL
ncbi:DUF4097 family beta strand repeat-containing protein [Herbidospora mongoliensis]|uniref:DUF4097 family beta strand repeat-containing protein n=1 Tax=Herbidospora mongoliensis TaxID=688067 RepID=UPI001FDEF183|nr:DUF4097 family beta strand repeat-containing protein [Herbidospora mongoliensis]